MRNASGSGRRCRLGSTYRGLRSRGYSHSWATRRSRSSQSAFAAGCPVVFKAHSGHMATADQVGCAIIRAAEKTGMPKGVFNMIFGAGVGEPLVKHAAIQAVGFTGSLHGGNALSKMAAEREQPIPVFAEMSSINPVILLPQALAARAQSIAKDLAASVTLGGGQFCTNPGLVIGVRSPEFTEFVQQLTQHMSEQAPHTLLNAGGLRNYAKGVEQLLTLRASAIWRGTYREARKRSRNC